MKTEIEDIDNRPGADIGSPIPSATDRSDDELLAEFFPDSEEDPEMRSRIHSDGVPEKEDPPAEPKPEPDPEPDPEPEPEDFQLPEDLREEEPEKKPAPPEDADLDKVQSALSDEKAKFAFGKLRTELKEARRALADAEERAKAAAAKPADELPPEKVQEYTQRIEELENRLGQVDLASSKKFREKYDVKLQGFLQRAVSMLKRAGADEKEAVALVQELRAKNTVERANALNDAAPALSGPIVNLLEDFDALALNRENELRNWRESRKSIEREQAEIENGRLFKAADELVRTVVDEMKAQKNPFYTEVKDPRWNQEVESRVESLRGIMKSADPEAISRLVAKGLASEGFEKLYRAERSRRAKLEQELRERESMYPRPSGSPSGAPKPGEQKTKSDEEILDGIFSLR